MGTLELHTVTRIHSNRYAYLESNHQLALRSPEFIVRQATPNFPDHAVNVVTVEPGEFHSTIIFTIDA